MEGWEGEVDDIFCEAAVAGAVVGTTGGWGGSGGGRSELACCHCLLGGELVK